MPKLHRFRALAFQRQDGRCFYCGHAMWRDDSASFAARHGVRLRNAWRFQCTAEHLKARQDGGGDEPGNIAAACVFCNQGRHKHGKTVTPEAYRAYIRSQMRLGKWHPVTGVLPGVRARVDPPRRVSDDGTPMGSASAHV